MSNHHSTLFAGSVAILGLALAALACSAPGLTVPPTITVVVIPTATLAPQPISPSATPAAPTPTATAVLPTPLSATPTATAMPTAKTKSNTSLRNGPGTGYTILGSLAPGLAVKLTGRNADKSWWQIEFPSSPDGYAWASTSNLDLSAATGVDALPVVNVPPPPTRAPVAATVTAPPGLIPVLRADKPRLTAGECTTLRWDVENVDSVFLDSGAGEEPVTGHDTRWICPDATTTYTLRAVNKDQTTQKYTTTVTVSACGDTPIISRFDASAVEVKAGTKVTLAWDVTCAQFVFFKVGSDVRQPVSGHDQTEVQPTSTTDYTLIVVAKNNSETKKTITVKIVP
jgi:Bacterial SH3 domain